MEEYDNMAQIYIQQMTERHAIVLLEYQKQLRVELASKPPKWSKELLEWRRRQHILARCDCSLFMRPSHPVASLLSCNISRYRFML
jgi:hypothetical protein